MLSPCLQTLSLVGSRTWCWIFKSQSTGSSFLQWKHLPCSLWCLHVKKVKLVWLESIKEIKIYGTDVRTWTYEAFIVVIGASGPGCCLMTAVYTLHQKIILQFYDEVLVMRLHKDQLKSGKSGCKKWLNVSYQFKILFHQLKGFCLYQGKIIHTYLEPSCRFIKIMFILRLCFLCYAGCFKYSLECCRLIFFQMIWQDMGWSIFVYAHRHFLLK